MACKENRGELAAGPCRALYVHVPFCRAKCRYCGFYSVGFSPGRGQRYLQAVAVELRHRAGVLAAPLDSVYVGGGTPTALGGDLLGRLLALLRPWIGRQTEWTVEANPSSVDERVAQTLLAAGVNRVPLGVQSLRAAELSTLGRTHTPQGARRAAAVLRSAGLTNLGVDLIYGIPGQSLASWQASLSEAMDLGISHLSCYALSFEPGTPLEADRRAGRIGEMDESLQADCYDSAVSVAAANGLEHYEISNFARPGRRCRHNMGVWRNQPYLGVGPAAASFLGGVRSRNAPDVDAYSAAWLAGRPAPASQEHLTGRAAMAETVMLALRLIEGLDRRAFRDRYGQDVCDVFPRSISRYQGLSALEVTEGRVRIQRRSLLVSDAILADLLGEA